MTLTCRKFPLGYLRRATNKPSAPETEVVGEAIRKPLTPVCGRSGGGPALVDLLGGQVQIMFEGITSSIGYVRAGKLRASAVTTRSAALPEILP